jgi:uracil-DNA glycosylase family 4
LSLDYSPAEDSSPKEPPCSQTESPAFELFQKMIGAMGLKLCEVAIFSSLSEIKESLHVPVVVVMGEKTAQDLLKTHASFNELRGHFQTVLTPSGSRNILLTYHPFELIQNPSLKKAAWEDLQQVMKLLN